MMNRRMFLQYGATVTATAVMPQSLFGMHEPEAERSLSFYNLHTGESLRTIYWEKGIYIPEGLEAISHILRDHRTGEQMEMNAELMDLLHAVRTRTGSKKPFRIISGYRSPKTNAMLNKTTSGVAKKSLHMQGKAIDINLPGVALSDLRKAAMDLKAGGVGYYPQSGFVHLDVGRVRHW